MANLNLKVSDVISRFYDVQEDGDIKGLYEVRPLGNPSADISWYFFSSNNATYNKKIENVVVRDISQSNSSYIDRLKASFEKAKSANKKIFWLLFVFGEGIGLDPSGMDWIASIETLVNLDDLTASLTLREYPIGGMSADRWEPCCKRVDQDKYFNTTFMSCKDSGGNFVNDYMKSYFELYDNRPYHDFINVNGVEKIDLKYLLELKDSEKFAKEAINILQKFDAFDDEIFDAMLDPDQSESIVHLKGYTILKEIPATVDDRSKLSDFVKCGTSRGKYYIERFTIRGSEYVITNNWYMNSVSNPDNRQPFVRWIIEALKRKGIIAYISTDVVTGGENIILYGVPGAGKSNYIKRNYLSAGYEDVRVVFHPDYTYSDFIGQIMPQIDAENDGKLKYKFVPGPFTEVLKKAIYNHDKKVYLVIEEINRGNAAAIFGELFQLLDRLDSGESEYGINNYEIAKYIYGNPEVKIKLPSNLWILGTMNTADQNVFTLDTAFQRRWDMKRIPNDVKKGKLAKQMIEKSNVCWGAFSYVVNKLIIQVDQEMGGSSDKRLGAYFIRLKDLSQKKFPEKVIKYLWDDALKMEQNKLFVSSVGSLDDAITIYENSKSDPVEAIIDNSYYTEMLSETKVILADPGTGDDDEEGENNPLPISDGSISEVNNEEDDDYSDDKIIIDPQQGDEADLDVNQISGEDE